MPRPDDEYEDDRPRRRRPTDDEPPPRASGNTALLIGLLVGGFVVCCGGIVGVGLWTYLRIEPDGDQVVQEPQAEQADEKPAAGKSPAEADAELSKRNLVQIGTAMQNYESAYGAVVHNSYETFKESGRPTGKPLLSWRVHLLPYLELGTLYRQFKMEEPWDSPNNQRLVSQMPDVYTTPDAARRAGTGRTYYRGFSHKGAVFEAPTPPQPPIRLRVPASFPDGSSITIAVVEAGEPTEWTRPDDIDLAPDRPRPSLGGVVPNLGYVHVLMMDGGVARMKKDVPEHLLRWLTDRQDRNVIANTWRAP